MDLSYTVDTYSAKGMSSSDTNLYLVVYRDEEPYARLMRQAR